MWQDKMRRLEGHGDECKLALVFKINDLRMLMTGKSKEYFDLWEADHDHTDAAEADGELLNKAKDQTTPLKITCSKEVTPWNSEQLAAGVSMEIPGASTTTTECTPSGSGGKGKSKGKGDCYNCSSPGRFSRECLYQPKGKSKGTGFQG